MSARDLAKLYLFSGKPRNLKDFPAEIYTQSFNFWKEEWGNVFEKAGDRGHLKIDNYLRQDVVASVVAAGDIAGLICFSFYRLDLASSFESGYLKQVPDEALRKIQELKSGSLMTFEYLCVNQKFRNKALGVSVAEVLCHIGNLVMAEYGAVAAVGTAVRTYGMDTMAARFGFFPLVAFEKFNLDCALVMNTTQTAKFDVSLNNHSFMKNLWSGRIDKTNDNLNLNSNSKAA
jgi:hypothetical protein